MADPMMAEWDDDPFERGAGDQPALVDGQSWAGWETERWFRAGATTDVGVGRPWWRWCLWVALGGLVPLAVLGGATAMGVAQAPPGGPIAWPWWGRWPFALPIWFGALVVWLLFVERLYPSKVAQEVHSWIAMLFWWGISTVTAWGSAALFGVGPAVVIVTLSWLFGALLVAVEDDGGRNGSRTVLLRRLDALARGRRVGERDLVLLREIPPPVLIEALRARPAGVRGALPPTLLAPLLASSDRALRLEALRLARGTTAQRERAGERAT